MAVPRAHEEVERRRAQLQGLRGDPTDVAGVGAAQPVRVDQVVQAEGVEADLEGAHREAAVRAAIRMVGRFLQRKTRERK